MNINNIIKLIKAYFYENWQKDVIYNFVIMLAVAFFATLMDPGDPTVVLFAAAILMVIYPCRLFSQLHNSSSRMHYLTIPANSSEKVVAGMFLANVYYVIGMVVFVAIGFLLGYGIMKLTHNPDLVTPTGPVPAMLLPDLATGILTLYTSIAVVFFASIYFKKSPFWKLMLTGFIVSLVLAAIMAGTEWLNFVTTVPAEIRNGNYVKNVHYVKTSKDWFQYVAYCVTIVYFYAMSFLRMRETEA